MKGIRNEWNHQLSHKGSQSIHSIQKENCQDLEDLDRLIQRVIPIQGRAAFVEFNSRGSQQEGKFSHSGTGTSNQ